MNKSLWTAAGLLLLILLWMFLGVATQTMPTTQDSASELNASPLTSVEMTPSQAVLMTPEILAYGDLLPIRETKILAETYGKIVKIAVKEGQRVSQNAVLFQLSLEDRRLKQKRAQAKVLAMKNKSVAVQKLQAKNLATESQVDELLAGLKAAEEEAERIEQEMAQLTVRAPFAGIVAQTSANLGDVIFKGDALAEFMDDHALIARVNVAQQEYPFLKLNAPVAVVFATGETKQGHIRFIAPKADLQTKTFRVEIQIANPQGLPSGISVTAKIPKQPVWVHFVSSALLNLDVEGTLGVKTLGQDDRVVFYPVKVVKASQQGVYVSGLPKVAHLITQGQGFVAVGEKVQPVIATPRLGKVAD